MSFKTDWIKIKPEVLETVLSNMTNPMEKFSLTIRFPLKEKYQQFLKYEEIRKREQDEQVDQADFESSQDQNEQNQKPLDESLKNQNKISQSTSQMEKKTKKKIQPTRPMETLHMNLQFQNAILYKTFYQEKFEQIGKKNKVQLSILPKKLKFVGQEVQDIQNAMEDAQAIINTIVIKPISKYGAQAYESQYIKKELQSKNVQILKVLNKFYLWYQIKGTEKDKEYDKKTQAQINQMRDRIFQKSCHKFYYLSKGIQQQQEQNLNRPCQNKPQSNQGYKLYLIDQDINFFQSKSEKWYEKLYPRCKSKMFQNQLKEKINEHYDEDKFIQLTGLKNSLIIHCNMEEQLALREGDIKDQYKKYQFFFITFDQKQNYDEIVEILCQFQYANMKKQPNFNEKSAYIHSLTNLEVQRQQKKELNEFLTVCIAFNKTKEDNKEMLFKLMKSLFKQNFNMKVSFHFNDIHQIECNLNEKLQFQPERGQKVVHVTPKNRNWPNFQTIISDYIIGHGLLKSDKQKEDVSMSGQTSINVTSPINDTTFMNDKTQDQINQSNILGALKQVQNGPIIMKKKPNQNQDNKEVIECQQVKQLNEYKFYIPQSEEEYNAKFDQTVNHSELVNNIKIPIKKRREFQELIKEYTSIQYRPYSVKVNPLTKNFKFYDKPTDKCKQIITMFAISPKRIGKSQVEDTFTIYPLSNSEKLKANGYLINIKRQNIIPSFRKTGRNEKTKDILYTCFFQAKNSQEYEVIRYLEYVAPLM